MEFYEYTGRPTDEEVKALKAWEKVNPNHLAIHRECPCCGSMNTQWVRQEWYICFNCDIPFTLWQAIDYSEFLEEQGG